MEPISILIPAYNEAAGIGRVLAEVQQVLPANSQYEIIVVNDGSTDDTEKIATAAGVRVISNPINMGYGFSLKRGFREAQHECVVILDGDGTYPINRIPDLLVAYGKGFDMVVGSRQGNAYWSSTTKRLARHCFKWMSEFVVGKKIPDINSGFRVIRRSKILPLLPDLSNAFSFTTSSTLLFFLQHYFVTYIPVEYHKRSGVSKVNYVKDALRTTQIMVDIIAAYNPIKLFLLLSFVPGLIMLLSLIYFLITVDPYSVLLTIGSLYATILFLALGFVATIFRKK